MYVMFCIYILSFENPGILKSQIFPRCKDNLFLNVTFTKKTDAKKNASFKIGTHSQERWRNKFVLRTDPEIAILRNQNK